MARSHAVPSRGGHHAQCMSAGAVAEGTVLNKGRLRNGICKVTARTDSASTSAEQPWFSAEQHYRTVCEKLKDEQLGGRRSKNNKLILQICLSEICCFFRTLHAVL